MKKTADRSGRCIRMRGQSLRDWSSLSLLVRFLGDDGSILVRHLRQRNSPCCIFSMPQRALSTTLIEYPGTSTTAPAREWRGVSFRIGWPSSASERQTYSHAENCVTASSVQVSIRIDTG